MKTKAITLMVALALAGISAAQQSDEERRLSEQFDRSTAQAIAAYPDYGNPESPLFKRIAEIDSALKSDGDPLYQSPDKPMILAWRAAKELGIIAVDLKPMQEAQSTPNLDGKAVPKMDRFKSVTIRKVEPDGLSIIHESGVAKIPIEKLTDEEQAKYGITMEGAAEYREQVAANAAAGRARQQEAARNQPQAPRASAPAPAAKFITADQVKIMWVKKLPQPRSLDTNYHQIMKSYKEFVAEITAGKRDLDAQETAATYNKSIAVSSGNAELANTFEAELLRISQAKSEAAALAQQEKQARRERADFQRLNYELRMIDLSLRGLR